jgi:hypothetical protein
MDTLDRVVIVVMIFCSLLLNYLVTYSVEKEHINKYHSKDNCSQCGKMIREEKQ